MPCVFVSARVASSCLMCVLAPQLRRKAAKEAAKDPKVQKVQKILDVVEKPAPVY